MLPGCAQCAALPWNLLAVIIREPVERTMALLAAFEAASATVNAASPLKALFLRVAAHDPELKTLDLKDYEQEMLRWPPERQAASLALLRGNSAIVRVNLSGLGLTDVVATALAAAMSDPAGGCEVLNLERNDLREPGLLAMIAALSDNTRLRELRVREPVIASWLAPPRHAPSAGAPSAQPDAPVGGARQKPVYMTPAVASTSAVASKRAVCACARLSSGGQLTGQRTTVTTTVEIALADLLENGGASSLCKLGLPLRE